MYDDDISTISSAFSTYYDIVSTKAGIKPRSNSKACALNHHPLPLLFHRTKKKRWCSASRRFII